MEIYMAKLCDMEDLLCPPYMIDKRDQAIQIMPLPHLHAEALCLKGSLLEQLGPLAPPPAPTAAAAAAGGTAPAAAAAAACQEAWGAVAWAR